MTTLTKTAVAAESQTKVRAVMPLLHLRVYTQYAQDACGVYTR